MLPPACFPPTVGLTLSASWSLLTWDLLTGLFEQRVEQYLKELPDTEQSGVNKFLKGLGEFCSRRPRQGRSPEGRSAQFTQLNRCLNSVSRKQNEVPPQKELRGDHPVNPEARCLHDTAWWGLLFALCKHVHIIFKTAVRLECGFVFWYETVRQRSRTVHGSELQSNHWCPDVCVCEDAVTCVTCLSDVQSLCCFI